VERRWRHFRTDRGRDVVREELKALSAPARAAVVAAMKRHLRGELLRYEEEHLGGDLHAIRVFLDRNTYRVIYAYEASHDQVLLALHCLQKKDRKLPRQAHDLAKKRLKEWRLRGKK
jgi:phage-related protein